jgi:hypothetical protein
MGKKRCRTLLASHYSAFPAIIIIQDAKRDDGRQIIIPIPVNGAILLRWLWWWVSGLLPSGQASALGFRLIGEFASYLEQLRLGFQFGTVLARSVAWGVLGV